MEIPGVVFLLITAALVGFKLTALVMASVWAMGGAFASKGLIRAARPERRGSLHPSGTHA